MSLYKRKNSPYWWTRFQVKGRVYQYSTKTGNKQRARQIETALMEKIRLQEHYGIAFGEKTSPTFRAAAEAWLMEISPDVKESTVDRYRKHVNTLVNFFGDAPCHEIAPEDVYLFKSARLKGRANSTVANELTVLKAILRRLVRRDDLVKSPAEGIRPPKTNQVYDRVLDDEEMRKYLEVAERDLKDFALVMSQTGARPSEVLSLKPKDIKGTQLLIRAGKTAGARRTIPLTEEVKEILDKRSPDLFQKLNYLAVNRAHHKAIKEAGLPKAQLYSFRHKFATDLISKGIPDSVVAKLLGHSNLGTIHKYVHPAQDDLEKAVKKLQK